MIHTLSCRQAGREQGWCVEFGTRAVVERKTGHSRTVVPAQLLALNGEQPVGSSPPHTPVVPCPGRNRTATATLSPPPRARASTASRCAHMAGCFTVSCTNATASSLLQGWRGVVGWLVRVGVGGWQTKQRQDCASKSASSSQADMSSQQLECQAAFQAPDVHQLYSKHRNTQKNSIIQPRTPDTVPQAVGGHNHKGIARLQRQLSGFGVCAHALALQVCVANRPVGRQWGGCQGLLGMPGCVRRERHAGSSRLAWTTREGRAETGKAVAMPKMSSAPQALCSNHATQPEPCTASPTASPSDLQPSIAHTPAAGPHAARAACCCHAGALRGAVCGVVPRQRHRLKCNRGRAAVSTSQGWRVGVTQSNSQTS